MSIEETFAKNLGDNDRRLEQFKSGEVRCGILNEQLRQAQELYDAIIAVLSQRTIEEAAGVVLDVIGKIIGQPRILLNQGDKAWFRPDNKNGKADRGVAFITGAQLAENVRASDTDYRRLIIAKIYKNHVKHGSIPEILHFAKLVYNVNISIRKLGLSRIELIVPSDTSEYIVQVLRSLITNDMADGQYFLPQCPTVSIESIVYKPPNPFAADRYNGRADFGVAAYFVSTSNDESN